MSSPRRKRRKGDRRGWFEREKERERETGKKGVKTAGREKKDASKTQGFRGLGARRAQKSLCNRSFLLFPRVQVVWGVLQGGEVSLDSDWMG